MSVSTQTMNGHRIEQKPIADVILRSLTAAQWAGRGFKNLYSDITQARGKAHGSAIHKALASLRKAELIVMHGAPGSRRTTYYLPRYAPSAEFTPLTAKRGPVTVSAAPEGRRTPGRPRRKVAVASIDTQAANDAAAEVSSALEALSQAAAVRDEVDARFVLSDPQDAPQPASVTTFFPFVSHEPTPGPAAPPELRALADSIADRVRAHVIESLGSALAKAHADAAAALKLAEDAERRYNELRDKLAALV